MVCLVIVRLVHCASSYAAPLLRASAFAAVRAVPFSMDGCCALAGPCVWFRCGARTSMVLWVGFEVSAFVAGVVRWPPYPCGSVTVVLELYGYSSVFCYSLWMVDTLHLSRCISRSCSLYHACSCSCACFGSVVPNLWFHLITVALAQHHRLCPSLTPRAVASLHVQQPGTFQRRRWLVHVGACSPTLPHSYNMVMDGLLLVYLVTPFTAAGSFLVPDFLPCMVRTMTLARGLVLFWVDRHWFFLRSLLISSERGFHAFMFSFATCSGLHWLKQTDPGHSYGRHWLVLFGPLRLFYGSLVGSIPSVVPISVRVLVILL